MRHLFTLTLLFIATLTFAHNVGTHEPHALRTWQIATTAQTVQASFLMFKDRMVFLEDADHQVLKYPIAALALEDRFYVVQRAEAIARLNTQLTPNLPTPDYAPAPLPWWPLAIGLLAIVGLYIWQRSERKHIPYLPIYVIRWGVGVLVLGVALSFVPKTFLGTDPLFVDAAFAPFKPKVKTRWDNQYFYVECLGLPSHPMMKGITAWQQQVPIPQCYTGTNAWSIPLNPVVAPTPTPTATNFFKGAIAIAANGIPVFNALNNRGVDSYSIGELDAYGGHCGRADDYHYHIAPMSLDSITADILPIAFALDGFAVYASKEPDGRAMLPLDANHGHYMNGVYHYHGTSNYPYMIANMVGVVTKDDTDQIIPQAQTKAIRPAGTPLSGAAITDHQMTSANAARLTYQLNNQLYTVNYSWTNNAVYTFQWGAPSGTTTSTHTGQACSLTSAVQDVVRHESGVNVYPNPARNGFFIVLPSPYSQQAVERISLFDAQGRLVHQHQGFTDFMALQNISSGLYVVKIQFPNVALTQKIVVE